MRFTKFIVGLFVLSFVISCTKTEIQNETAVPDLIDRDASQVEKVPGVDVRTNIVGYMNSEIRELHVLPDLKEDVLARMGAEDLGNGTYRTQAIEKKSGNIKVADFKVVTATDRAKLYELFLTAGYGSDDPHTQLKSDNVKNDLDPKPVEYIIYDQAKCTKVYDEQVSDCTYVGPGKYIKVWRWALYTCQKGEDICIERRRIIRTTGTYSDSNCSKQIGGYDYKYGYDCN